MPELVVAAGDGGRTRVRDIRRFWHVVQTPPSLLKRLEPAYYVLITLAIGGPFVYGTASAALSEDATPGAAAVVGGLVVVGVAGHHRGVDAVRAAGCVVAMAILGLLCVVGAALVAG